MALIVAVVADAAALRRECADHVEASFPGLCKLVPEECAPAALEVVLAWTTESYRRDMTYGGPGDAVAQRHYPSCSIDRRDEGA